MKKLLIACLSVLASVAAYGQGQVNFLNNAGTPIRTNLNGVIGNMTGANQFRIGLYTAPAGTVNESLFTLVAVATNSSLVGGRIGSGGGIVDLAGNTGTPIAYQVKAWSLSRGASYEAALAAGGAYTGKSPISGPVTPAVAGAPAPSLFGPGAGGAVDFPGQLNSGIDMVIPEPSSIALGLLGLGAIALFRRRK